MFSRIRVVVGIALMLTLVTTVTAFAKGSFAFIAITGPNLQEAVRVTDSALTADFFTFANFYEDRTEAPASPGEGYEITRYYVDGTREIIFDRLHYYPEAGFVFYDGIENGESEYDGEWYSADPEIKTVFASALAIQTGPVPALEEKQPLSSASQPVAAADFQSIPIIIVVATGLAALFAFAFWQRKSSAH
jgi:hypothetical protein